MKFGDGCVYAVHPRWADPDVDPHLRKVVATGQGCTFSDVVAASQAHSYAEADRIHAGLHRVIERTSETMEIERLRKDKARLDRWDAVMEKKRLGWIIERGKPTPKHYSQKPEFWNVRDAIDAMDGEG